MNWLLTFSASEGTRFFWDEARKLFRERPLDPQSAAERIFERLDPLVRSISAEEGSAPAFIAHARLALAFWDRLVAHRLTVAAAERVRRVPMASFPVEAPQMMRRPWLLEVRKPLDGERLYGDTTALGCYPTDEPGQWMLQGWMIVQGEPRIRAMFWMQNWTPDRRHLPELAQAGYEWLDGTWVEAARLPREAFRERRDWFHEGVRFATVLGALLEAENTFLRTHDTVSTPESGKRSGRVQRNPPRWIVRHVTLDGSEADSTPGPGKGTGTPLSTDGLTWTEVPVREYIRLQPSGPSRQERKWIRIKAHVSHRWTSPIPKRIVVDGE
jgi:hypothetical protein